jgi:iron-sulfur cluster assembly accessory protein
MQATDTVVQLTEKAAAQVRKLVGTAVDRKGLRISVSAGGCSGLQYEMSMAEAQEGDVQLDQYGIKVFLDQRSSLYLQGSVIDYHDGLTAAGFRITNPNAKATCGCGTSFEA